MSESERLESRLSELQRARRRLRAAIAEAEREERPQPPEPEPSAGERDERGATARSATTADGRARSEAEAAEDAVAGQVHEQLARLLPPPAGDDRAPPVPADPRGLLRAAEDLGGRGIEVTLRCGTDAEATSGTLTAVLSEATGPIGLTLELVPGTPRENAEYARRVVAAHPSVVVRPGPRPDHPRHDDLRDRPEVTIASGAVVGPRWLELLLADAAALDAGTAVARSPQDPDARSWLGQGGAPLWAAAADVAPLAAAHPPAAEQGPTWPGSCVLALPGAGRSGTWVRSRALAARQEPHPPSPMLPDAQAHAARLAAALGRPLRVGFVMLGVPPGGAGGTHSIYQETVGLLRIGAEATILLPASRVAHAREVYPDADEEVFTPFAEPVELARRAQRLDVVVATEFPTVRLFVDALPDYPGLLAYYLQDYEPLFAPPESRAADEAMLSLGALPAALLFAKTRWLCSLLESVHGLRVAKVEPSLDHGLFRAGDRPSADGHPRLRVVAMVRPRTSRRRPAATIRVLERLRSSLGDAVEAISFGCPAGELHEFLGRAPVGVEHRGILGRPEVANLLAGADAFLDLSIYQAFGRSGLEAMACGCVPVLPQLGGAEEYAVDGGNAILLDVRDDDAVLAAVRRLADDREAFAALRAEGLRTVRRFSIERAALSLYALFAQALVAQ